MVLPFAGVVLVLAILPGPTTAVVMRQALRSGRRGALATTAGGQTALLLWAVAAAFGLSALVAASQVAYHTLRIIGALVLVGLGLLSLLRSRRTVPHGDDGPMARVPTSGWRGYRIGLVTDLANPKAAVFAMSFLPQFVPPGAPVLGTTLLLGPVWVAVDATWYVILLSLVVRSRRLLDRSRGRLERASGLVLIGLGLRVALERR